MNELPLASSEYRTAEAEYSIASSVQFSVIVPTIGRTERLRETLESLLECNPQPDEIVVVDGEASEATRMVAGQLGATNPNVRIVYVPSAPGLTRQRNRGLAAASSSIAVFVDDDMRFSVTPDLFRRIERAFAESDVVGVTGLVLADEPRRYGHRQSRIRRLFFGERNEGSVTRFGYPQYLRDTQSEVDVEYMSGGCMCVRRDLAREVGFDESLTGYAIAEDQDFGYRLSRRGRIRYIPGIVVEHEPFGPRDFRETDRALVVNRTYLFRKNFAQTPRAKLEFAAFIGLLAIHRVFNADWAGLRGVSEGIADVLRGRLPPLPAEAHRRD